MKFEILKFEIRVPRPIPKRFVVQCTLLVLAVTSPPRLQAQDTIVVRNETTGAVTSIHGLVVAWDRDQLVLSANGRESEIAARRVVDVKYARRSEHLQAEAFYLEQRFDQADLACEQAFQAENRTWVMEELRAIQLKCALATGNIERAIGCFVAIRELAPRTRFGHLVPLTWTREPKPDGVLAGQLDPWLKGADAERSLMAASWLFATREADCSARLRELQNSEDRIIAQLAAAQLWRGEWMSADTDELDRWNALIAKMDERIQAGPRFLAAMARKRQSPDDRAVIALMQIPVLFPDQYVLAAEALHEASSALAAMGRSEEAQCVAHELGSRYGFSQAAQREAVPVETPDGK